MISHTFHIHIVTFPCVQFFLCVLLFVNVHVAVNIGWTCYTSSVKRMTETLERCVLCASMWRLSLSWRVQASDDMNVIWQQQNSFTSEKSTSGPMIYEVVRLWERNSRLWLFRCRISERVSGFMSSAQKSFVDTIRRWWSCKRRISANMDLAQKLSFLLTVVFLLTASTVFFWWQGTSLGVGLLSSDGGLALMQVFYSNTLAKSPEMKDDTYLAILTLASRLFEMESCFPQTQKVCLSRRSVFLCWFSIICTPTMSS